MKPLIWVHADSLSPFAPPFQRYPEAVCIFVLDPEQLETDEWAMGRIAFLFESALDAGCEIRRGDTTSELLWAARANGCDTIVTGDSPDPQFRRVCEELRKSVKLEVLPPDGSPTSPVAIDPRRFAQYWKRAQPSLVTIA